MKRDVRRKYNRDNQYVHSLILIRILYSFSPFHCCIYSAMCFHFLFIISTIWKRIVIVLTQWSGVTHICVSKLDTIGSDNGFLPGRHQAII